MDVQPRHLRYFVAVAEELSFTRAAARLHVAQQAISDQVKQLEQVLGVRLFERTTRRVELTAVGESFLGDAREILAQLDRAVQRARALERSASNRLVLGFGEGAALTLTEPILSAFRERHEGVELVLRQYNYDVPSVGLGDRSVDVGFVRLPIAADGLVHERLFSEPVVVVLPVGHRLAGRESVRAADLLAEPILGSATDDPEWNAFWQLDEFRDGRPAPVASRSTTLLEELQKVVAGVGIVLTAAAARWMPFPGVELVPVLDAPRSVVAVAARGDHLVPLVRSFIELCCEVRDANPVLVEAVEAPRPGDAIPTLN
jgi:DNA-binding transcriptional LysR family regulator